MCRKKSKYQKIPVYEFAFLNICKDVRSYSEPEIIAQLDKIWAEAVANDEQKQILEAGSSEKMHNALTVCASNGNVVALKWYILKMQTEGETLMPDKVDKNGYPPLYVACSRDYKDFTEDDEENEKIGRERRFKIVELLLEINAFTDFASVHEKMTALHWAAFLGHA